MAEFLIKTSIKATVETNKRVVNFDMNSLEAESMFELVSRFVQWFNQEHDTNFEIKDLNDIDNYRQDRVGGEK